MDNILNLCPNHHAQFGEGQLQIDPDNLVIEAAPDEEYVGERLILRDDHNPRENLRKRDEMF
jgi:5-methylcytosine-specific restriction protein A